MYQNSLIPKINMLINCGSIKLLVPEILREEWERNKQIKIHNPHIEKIEKSQKNALYLLSLMSDNGEEKKQDIIKFFLDIEPNTLVDQLISNSVSAVEELINHENSIHFRISDEIKIVATNHAVEKKAPFRNKNTSMADALMFFSVLEWAEKNNINKIFFVSENCSDFSQNKKRNRENLHDDLQKLTQSKGIEINYSIDIADVLTHVEDSSITENEVIIGKTLSEIIFVKNYLNNSPRSTITDQLKFQVEQLENQLLYPIEKVTEQQREFQKTIRYSIEGLQEQQRQLEEKLRSPIEKAIEQQRKFEKTLRSPIEEIQEQQRQLEEKLRYPIEKAIEQQREFEKTLRSPIEGIQEQQRQLEEKLRSPIEKAIEQQREFEKTLRSPTSKRKKKN